MVDACYMCDRPETCREHVPPRFLFPEQKDVAEGVDFRRNLVTVPSCDVHNSEKCKDDEYLVCVLVACQDVNNVGETHFAKKIMRAIGRRPALMMGILEDSSPAFVRDATDSDWHETRKVVVDEVRFYGALEKIARALYRHRFGEKWRGNVNVVPHFLVSTAPDARETNRAYSTIKTASEQLFAQSECLGENPEVFYYNVHVEAATDVTVMRLVFYGGAAVTVMFRRHGP